jgi:hypothetical protein
MLGKALWGGIERAGEVANVVVFLASQGNSSVPGIDVIDGRMKIWDTDLMRPPTGSFPTRPSRASAHQPQPGCRSHRKDWTA